MTEFKLELTDISVQDFYGPNNDHLKRIRKEFPKLKIVSRGKTISAVGTEERLIAFEHKIMQILAHLSQYNSLDEQALDELLQAKSVLPNAAGGEILLHGARGKHIKAHSSGQKTLVRLVDKNDMVFAVGPAGTGKTYTSVALAVRALKNKEVKKIVLTRPAVEAGESLGFLPGDLKEKLDPYMQPLYDALQDMIPFEKLKSYIEKSIIEVAPLAFMRGRTLDEAFVILDEAQNTSPAQMKMFLTRMGRNAKFIITGDPEQVDLPPRQKSGLKDALNRLHQMEGIGHVRLSGTDVMRHKLVKQIIEAYKQNEE